MIRVPPRMRAHLIPLLAVVLTACPYVGQEKFEDLRDYDGDGLVAERFGGRDCDDHDPHVGDCDADRDGHRSAAVGGDDCDDDDGDVHPNAEERCNGVDDDCDGLVDDEDDAVSGAPTWYADTDGDGHGDPDAPVAACAAPAGHVRDATDCDDTRDDVHPGAVEFCDDVDRDCDGDPTDNAVDPVPIYADGDGDGYGAGPQVDLACAPGPGQSATDDDCDDAEPLAHPGAAETWYDGVDSDCDGRDDFDQDGDGEGALAYGGGPDCDDTDPAVHTGATELCGNARDDDCDGLADSADGDAVGRNTYYQDLDGDGEGDPAVPGLFCPNDVDFARWVTNATDCDDTNPLVNSGQVEDCNGYDDDCNGVVDDVAGTGTFFLDADGDGFGDPASVAEVCAIPGYVSQDVGFDCDDTDPAVYPGAPEICGDGHPTDCDRDPLDCDGDGHLDGVTDCDDTSALVYPGAPERCDDLVDNDCDGFVNGEPGEALDGNDVDPATATFWYDDADGDGYGNANDPSPVFSCEVVPGKAPNDDDCNDSEIDGATVHPGALEICNGISDDCDGQVDEEPVLAPIAYYPDADGDGVGASEGVYAENCDPPAWSWSLVPGDCDDTNPNRSPFRNETCDGIDNDCDLLVDDDDPGAALFGWYLDGDGDGYGGLVPDHFGCAPLDDGNDYISVGGDCDDADPARNPGAVEVCDGIDNDCDQWVDGADPDLSDNIQWYPDADADGYGDATATPVVQCGPPANHVENNLDCDDGRASISPVASEVCDTIDNDCDGLVDDQDSDVVGGTLHFTDADGDGFGDPNAPVSLCAPQPGFALTGTDCDDTDGALYPGQVLVVSPVGGPWTTIQAAIDAACPGGEVRIAGGVWSEQLDLLGKGLVVGGLDPTSRPTLLGAPAPAIVATNAEPAGTRVENLVIASSAGTAGAAAQVGPGSRVAFEAVDFEALSAAGDGGAVWVDGGVADFQSCRFDTVSSGGLGGAIYGSDAVITAVDTTFDAVSANDGAAVYAWNTDLLLVNAAVNTGIGGAAIRVGADAPHYASLSGLTLFDTGEPLRLEEVDAFLEDVDSYKATGPLVVAGINRAVSLDAAGVRVGGHTGTGHAVELYGPQLAATVRNLVVAGNAADGLLAQSVSGLVLENATVASNGGVGLTFASGLGATVRNCLIYDNAAFPELVHSGSWSTSATVAYNLFTSAAEAGTWGATNLAGDPMFHTWHPALDPLRWDLHPRAGGPAINAGDPSVLDNDGSRSDLGATGGPLGDALWYADADNDTLADGWEADHFGGTSQRGNDGLDDDNDGLDTVAEFTAGTDPLLADTDGDGTPDGPDGAPLDPTTW